MFYVHPIGDKKAGKIVRREEVMNELSSNGFRIRELEQIGSSILGQKKYIKVPCRKCYACRLNYSAEWATRIELECQKDDYNYFITLTYDDEHLPSDGDLHPEDMKRFINTLRKSFERKGIKDIKYFYCGEYGPTTGRCHFHMILMHCPLDENKFHSPHIDSNFKEHFKHYDIEKWWGKGFVDVAKQEWSNAAYVARYCMKKQTNKEYEEMGKVPEYIRMSKGIGMDYYQQHKDEIYQHDEIIMKTVKGNNGSYRPPKAFDIKKEQEDPIGFQKIKKERIKKAEKLNKAKRAHHTYTDLQELVKAAERVTTKQKLLPRDAND